MALHASIGETIATAKAELQTDESREVRLLLQFFQIKHQGFPTAKVLPSLLRSGDSQPRVLPSPVTLYARLHPCDNVGKWS